LKNIPQKLAIISRKVKTGLFATVNRIEREKDRGQDFAR